MNGLTPAKVTAGMLTVVGALIAAYVAKTVVAREAPPPTIVTQSVPVAAEELPAGTVVEDRHLALTTINVDQLHPNVVPSAGDIVGRTLTEAIASGAPVHSWQLERVQEAESETESASALAAGMRAVSIDIHGGGSLLGALLGPNQYVDVHLTPTAGANDSLAGGMTVTLFRGVRVINATRDSEEVDVTLEVTPQQANVLILAREHGRIALTFNPDGPGDGQGGVSVGSADRATLDEILGVASPDNAGGTKAQPFFAERYEGRARSIMRFENGRRADGIDAGT